MTANGEAAQRGFAGDTSMPVRAAVILPWERRERPDGTPGEQSRAAEARLAEAVGLAASIGLVVVHAAILPLRERRPATLLGAGQLAVQGDASPPPR